MSLLGRFAVGLVTTSLVACSWSTFDSQRDEAPVDANGRPDGVSSREFPVAIAGVPGGGGMRMVAAGDNPISLTTFQYLPDDGVLRTSGNDIAAVAGPDSDLDEPPTLVAAVDEDNESGLVFLGGLDDINRVLVFDAGDGRMPAALLAELDMSMCGANIDDFTNMGFAMAFANTDLGNRDVPDLILFAVAAAGHTELVAFTDFNPMMPLDCQRCELRTEGNTAIRGIAMAPIDLDGVNGDQIAMTVVEGTEGPRGFEVFDPGDAFAGGDGRCFSDAQFQPHIPYDNAGAIDNDDLFGLQIAVGDFDNDEEELDDLAILRGASDQVRVQLNPAVGEPGTEVMVLAPPSGQALQLAAADINNDDRTELLMGNPGEPIDGVQTGAVLAFTVSVNQPMPPPPVVIHDAQPVEGQRYGGVLAIGSFRRGPENFDVILVGADDEVFSIFAATEMAPDPRFPP